MAITDPLDGSVLINVYTTAVRNNLRAKLEEALKPVYDQLLKDAVNDAMKDLEVHIRAHREHYDNRMIVEVLAGKRKET